MEKIDSNFALRTASVLGALAVALGAFGAHGLKPLLNEYQILIYEKAVFYQFVHTLMMAIVGLGLTHRPQSGAWRWSVVLFLFGVIFFSGSLYLLACRDLITFPVGWAGPITPIGGVSFIAGWVAIWLGVKK